MSDYDEWVERCVREGLVRRLRLRNSIATTRKGRRILKLAAASDVRVQSQIEAILAGRSLIGGAPTSLGKRDDFLADLVVSVVADGIVPLAN